MRRTAIELSVIFALSIVLAFFFWDPMFRGPGVKPIMQVLSIPFIPALFIGTVIGGVHTATQVHMTVGVLVELIAIWGVWRMVNGARKQGKEVREK